MSKIITKYFFLVVTSLRDVQLLVEPATVVRGGVAALICSRDMQEAPLYSVKWYRGNHEFYRFTPMEEPDTRVFGLPGIYVDVSLYRKYSVKIFEKWLHLLLIKISPNVSTLGQPLVYY